MEHHCARVKLLAEISVSDPLRILFSVPQYLIRIISGCGDSFASSEMLTLSSIHFASFISSIPLAPSDVPIVNVTEDVGGILVMWDEPLSPNGVLQYEVTLQREDLARPENTFPDLVSTTSERNITFDVDVLPYHLYTATVVPFTAAPKRGNPTNDSHLTAEASE